MVFAFLSLVKMYSEVCTQKEPIGNTRAIGSRTRARAFQLTLNEVDKYSLLRDVLTSYKTLKYLISCKETAPTTGHEHIHIYVNFNTVRSLSVKKLYGAHVEVCKGTPKQNIAYIEKGGVILDEIGERPHQGTLSVRELKEIENSEDLPDSRLYNIWRAVKHEPQQVDVDEWHKDVEVVYVTGPSGAGKSLKAKEILKEHGVKLFDELKYENGFWMGVVKGAGAAVYDDFRPSHMSASEFINFIDYNVHNLNVKGGSMRNKYNLVIITSVIPPEDLYVNMTEEARAQWMRRMRVIDLSPVHDELDDL